MSTGIEELAITEDEGAAFMGAAQNVMRHYSVQGTQKTLDWVSFAGVALGMYIPRLVIVGSKRKAAKAAPQTVPAPFDPLRYMAEAAE